MPTYTKNRDSSSHRRMLGRIPIWTVVGCFLVCVQATAEDFAQPPTWTDDVTGVFFDDARKALSGEPPTARPTFDGPVDTNLARSNAAIWPELITAEAIESAVKSSIIRAASTVKQPARFTAGLHSDCRRELTLLGTLFGVISDYPIEVRWKSAAPQYEQLCLRTAEACATGSTESLMAATRTLTALDDLLRGQASSDAPVGDEPATAEFAPLMQHMELLVQSQLADKLLTPTVFRRQGRAVSENAQLLAMLSQVIRGEAYGYGDDDAYRGHADRLRDAARQLTEAVVGEDFQKATQASAAIGKACVDCHADYRG
jgi:Cytochrome C'